MFERYTERARQVIVLAQDESRNFKHGYVGTEHLLLGLIREEEGLAARVLHRLQITEDKTREWVGRVVGAGEEKPVGQIPLTPRAKKVLELALREALSLGHNYIGTEHILLGLVREDEGVASRILRDEEVTAEIVRNEVIRHLSGPKRVASNRWRRPDVQLEQFWVRGEQVFRVVGICDEPTVVIEDIVTKQREHHAITSPNFGEFSLLERREAS